jgi:hypothetical protein
MGLLRHIYILTWKTILIELNRHFRSTSFRAFALPVAYIIFLGYALELLHCSLQLWNCGFEPRPIVGGRDGWAGFEIEARHDEQ